MSKFDAFVAGYYEILPGSLYQASFMGSWEHVDQFDCLFACTPRIDVPDFTLELHCVFPFDDKPELPNLDIMHGLAELAAIMIERDRRVVWRCDGGMNRSGLGCALTLCALSVISGAEALAEIRVANPDALYNETFVAYLEQLN